MQIEMRTIRPSPGTVWRSILIFQRELIVPQTYRSECGGLASEMGFADGPLLKAAGQNRTLCQLDRCRGRDPAAEGKGGVEHGDIFKASFAHQVLLGFW